MSPQRALGKSRFGQPQSFAQKVCSSFQPLTLIATRPPRENIIFVCDELSSLTSKAIHMQFESITKRHPNEIMCVHITLTVQDP
eukprot:1842167-Amphidinium_carterae.1